MSEERRKRREWAERFREYGAGWESWDGGADKIPWPTKSGRRRDVDEEEVRAFFVRGLDLETLGEREFTAKLKEQRVRWHPDKVQRHSKFSVRLDIERLLPGQPRREGRGSILAAG